MRQPFWIINSVLLLLVLGTFAFLYFSVPEIPERKNIEPPGYKYPTKTEMAEFNISKIYEADIFDTYQKEIPVEVAAVGLLPEPPSPLSVHIPAEPRPQFIEPLPITLKGIVVVHDDDTKNRAIIMDNRTAKETLYKVGDMIEDAQLIRIFSSKVILIRANGQQEVLYLREKDAKLDPNYAGINNWQEVIAQIDDTTFSIDVPEFISRIQSLAQFIDTLEAVTAYRQGESIGVRVTNVGPGTLAQALGLTKDDIILTINETSIGSTQNRLAVYNQLLQLKTDDTIAVTVSRNNQEIMIHYQLKEVQKPKKQEIGMPPPAQDAWPEQKKQLEEKYQFAPTLKEIRQREKINMMEKGKRPTQNVLSNLNE